MDAKTTYGEWKLNVLLLLTGPNKMSFSSGEEAILKADEDVLQKMWGENLTPYQAAKVYSLKKSGLVGADPLFVELLDRLQEAGRPGDALSASEFGELVNLVESLQDKADAMGRVIVDIYSSIPGDKDKKVRMPEGMYMDLCEVVETYKL